MARGRGLSREKVNQFFDLLENQVSEHCLEKKPQNIWNMDESGLQLINKVGKVMAPKGSKAVHKITTGERGETATIIACCSAEGRFLPPVVIYKGKNLKMEFQDGLPPGSQVFMNPQSAYVNSDLFFRWFKDVFLPRKSLGRNVLILDGHCSHCSSTDLLELAEENDVSLLCLPAHTTHALQPLDRVFFGPLKNCFKNETNTWVQQNPGRPINRYQVGPLISRAWVKAATVGNGINGFVSTGIHPLNRHIIPDHFFAISDSIAVAAQNHENSNSFNATVQQLCDQNMQKDQSPKSSRNFPSPTKNLNEILPIPTLPASTSSKRNGQSAVLLTSPENITKVKSKKHQKEQAALKKSKAQEARTAKINSKQQKTIAPKNITGKENSPPARRKSTRVSKRMPIVEDTDSETSDMMT